MFSIIHAALAATLAAAPSPQGLFASPDGKRTMRIECAAETCEGRLEKAQDAPELVGKVVLKDLTPSGKEWKGQVVLVRRGGKELPVVVSLPDSSTLRMKVKAGLLGQSRDWTRVR